MLRNTMSVFKIYRSLVDSVGGGQDVPAVTRRCVGLSQREPEIEENCIPCCVVKYADDRDLITAWQTLNNPGSTSRDHRLASVTGLLAGLAAFFSSFFSDENRPEPARNSQNQPTRDSQLKHRPLLTSSQNPITRKPENPKRLWPKNKQNKCITICHLGKWKD